MRAGRHGIRIGAAIGALLLATAGAAQTGNAPAATRHDHPDQVITVTGRAASEPVSSWKRAESDHVVAYSSGSEAELKRVVRNLELLHTLMTRLYRRGQTGDDAARVEIVLLDSQDRLRALQLRDLRVQREGPYADGFLNQIYYDPRDDRDVLAVSRSDQTIELDTQRRRNLDCDDSIADGGIASPQTPVPGAGMLCGSLVQPPPQQMSGAARIGGTNVNYLSGAVRGWETKLYSGFAEHFLLTYAPAAYPRWYLDGIGALFSTITVKPDGSLDYAGAPASARSVFRSYGYPDVSEILSGRYLNGAGKGAAWSPYGAWLITYYFVFSNPKPERLDQFRRYMTAIAGGTPMAEAAAVFGDTGRLQRDVIGQLDRATSFARAAPPATAIGEPLVATLSASAGAIVEPRLELDSRLSAAPATAWIAQLRDKIGALAFDAEAQLLLAEAECRGGEAEHCLATADRVLAADPDNVRAIAWKGWALTDVALARTEQERATMMAEARQTIGRAIARDGQASLPRLALFRSFVKAGEGVPPDAVRGMAQVIRANPAAPGPRLELARELVHAGQSDLARRLLTPVIYGAYDGPERTAALQLFAGGTGGPAQLR